MTVLGLLVARPAIQQAGLEAQLKGFDYDACIAAPASWGWSSGDVSFAAYDRSGHSENLESPPVEARLLRQAIATEEVAAEDAAGLVVFVVPYAPDGPCAVLRLSSRDVSAAVGPRLLGVLGVAVLVAMVLAALGTHWLAVRPLEARIKRLAVAARAVGSEAFAPQPTNSDALGYIDEVLSQSHRRIVEVREALEQRNLALEEHLAGIAHDLRTPLSSMHLALEAVAAEADSPLQPAARRALADVVYLSSIVENLHHATRLRHEVDVSSGAVELCDLVGRLEQRFDIVGRHAQVEVAASVPEREVWAACTPALAERAVANIIQNAVEHNPEPGHVAITLSLLDDGRRFELVVADDGPGLPESTLASLENESFVLDVARQRGPGLGMLITAEVARRAGWSLSYEALEPVGLLVRLEGGVVEAP
jgi:signal transduction histidine kinase